MWERNKINKTASFVNEWMNEWTNEQGSDWISEQISDWTGLVFQMTAKTLSNNAHTLLLLTTTVKLGTNTWRPGVRNPATFAKLIHQVSRHFSTPFFIYHFLLLNGLWYGCSRSFSLPICTSGVAKIKSMRYKHTPLSLKSKYVFSYLFILSKNCRSSPGPWYHKDIFKLNFPILLLGPKGTESYNGLCLFFVFLFLLFLGGPLPVLCWLVRGLFVVSRTVNGGLDCRPKFVFIGIRNTKPWNHLHICTALFWGLQLW